MAATMIAVTAPAFTDPSGYELSTVARPLVSEPTDVLIQVHAASVNPVDVKKASGAFKRAISEQFPYTIGYDAAGVVVEVGSGVTRVQVGDEVYVRLPEASRGSWSEFAKCDEFYVSRKPSNFSFSEAASIPLAGVTALQALGQYKGSLEGKTVFVTAGLSGTGLFACQLAKSVFHAGKVITTVSTSKIPKVPQLLGQGVVDQIIDYTKTDPRKEIPPASVDFFFDTTAQSMQFLSLMVPSTSTIVSISTMPSGATLQNWNAMKRPDNPRLPLIGRIVLDTSDTIRRLRAWRYGANYLYWFMQPNGTDLDKLRDYAEEGKVVTVVGSKVSLHDIDQVRDACMMTHKAKGGIGKTVLEVIKDTGGTASS